MKVTVWGINYSPELVGISVYNTGLCEYLSRRGHEVTMVTAFPYYPQWKKFPEDSGCLYRQETIQGVNVWRCWQYVPARAGVIGRVWHEASFVTTSFFRLLTMPPPDVMIAVGPPLFLGWMAAVLSDCKGLPFVYHVQDLQPDAALSLGMLKPGLLIQLLFAAQKFAYARAAKVSSISKRMCSALSKQGASSGKLVHFPNWVKLPEPSSIQQGSWKRKQNITSQTRIVSYSGALGAKQGLDVVIDAAELLLNRENLTFVIVGDGPKRGEYMRYCQKKKIDNVIFLDLLSPDEHTELLIDSEICLIPQRAGTSSPFFPSKLLKILATGRPFITNADPNSALADVVKESKSGLLCKGADSKSLADSIEQLLVDDVMRETMSNNGRNYACLYEENRVLAEFEQVLIGLAANR